MSHNVHLIPKRYRAAAFREQQRADGKPSNLKRNRKWRRRPANLVKEYLRRQKNGKWLETHIWHAKRMFMAVRWGYKIAMKPTLKIYRVSYRHTSHGCTIYDASYYNVFELCGPETSIISLLRRLCPSSFCAFAAKSYLNGARSGRCHLYHPEKYPFQLICPVQFLWRPPQDGENRLLWLMIHPSAVSELSSVIESLLVHDGDVKLTVRENHLVRFELRGQRSTLMLQNCLQHQIDTRDAHTQQFWEYFTKTANPNCLPEGLVIASNVRDPRLKMPNTRTLREKSQPNQPRKLTRGPDDNHVSVLMSDSIPHGLAQGKLWDEDERKELVRLRTPQELLRKKKAQHAFSIRYAPEPSEKLLPILMIQNKGGLSRGYGGGWDLLLPAGYAHMFWKAFVFSGAIPIGLQERRAQLFEQGFPSFPEDYPDTNSYLMDENELGRDRKVKALLRPKSKRMNFQKIGIKSIYKVDWGLIIPHIAGADKMSDNEDTVDHDVILEGNNSLDEIVFASKPPLPILQKCTATRNLAILRGEALASFLNSVGMYSQASLDLGRNRKFALSSLAIDRCLVPVRLRPCRRGVPKYNAQIIMPTREDFHELANDAAWAGRSLPVKWRAEADKHLGCLVGFATYGNFSLVRAGGFAIGFCSASAIQDLVHLQNEMMHPGSLIVLFRNPTSRQFRPAYLSFIV
eukprot:TRINITY_DN3132_c0_g1_i5.p1 TRINITY_DN3132_c0_g1~~TRINITY_DN3132_c0_g1_i5.p1  ORF type:complete len:686 (-),score=89.81 TRINITY_DN3132_c0_g1_i5:113-2170(-)